MVLSIGFGVRQAWVQIIHGYSEIMPLDMEGASFSSGKKGEGIKTCKTVLASCLVLSILIVL